MFDGKDANAFVRIIIDGAGNAGTDYVDQEDMSIWHVYKTDTDQWMAERFPKTEGNAKTVEEILSRSSSVSQKTDEEGFFRVMKTVCVKQKYTLHDDYKQWQITRPEQNVWLVEYTRSQDDNPSASFFFSDSDSDSDSDSGSTARFAKDETTDPLLSRPLKLDSPSDSVTVKQACDEVGQTLFPTYKLWFKFIKAREHIPLLPPVKSGYYCYFIAPTRRVCLQFRLMNCKVVGMETDPTIRPRKWSPLSNDLWEKINAVLKRHGIEVEL